MRKTYTVPFADKDSTQLQYSMETAFTETASTWNPVKQSDRFKVVSPATSVECPKNLCELFFLGFKNLLCSQIDMYKKRL